MRKRNHRLIDWLAVPVLACPVIVHALCPANADSASPVSSTPTASGAPAATWVVPDIDKLPDDDWGRTVRYGRDLMTKTASLIGPEAADPTHRFAGNNLNCASCHLEAGAKEYGLPYVGAYADFPKLSRAFGRGGNDRGSHSGLHGAKHERQKASCGGPRNDRDGSLSEVPLDRPSGWRASRRARFWSDAGADARSRSGARSSFVRADLRGLSRRPRARAALRRRGRRPRILNPSAVGTGQLQRRRGHGAAYRRSELHPQQHAGGRDVAGPSRIG